MIGILPLYDLSVYCKIFLRIANSNKILKKRQSALIHMNNFIKQFINHKKNVRTFNDSKTNASSQNPVLDLFFIAGASRTMSDADIVKIIALSYEHNKIETLKVLFWARNCRGGAGERRFFRLGLRYLSENDIEIHNAVLKYVPIVGRWDDLFETGLSYVLTEYREYIKDPKKDIALLAKWTPRKGRVFNVLRKELDLKPKQLRQILVYNTKVVETQMCENKWKDIEYKKVPSVAFKKYSRAFRRHSEIRFDEYINKVLQGKEKINADVLFPHNIYSMYKRDVDHTERKTITALWNALPNYMNESEKYQILPVCDVSGSMMGLPMDVSVSLGCYLSERNNGAFKDAFITFSSNPKMHYLKGNIADRFDQLEKADWGMNTNLDKVFDKILEVARKNNLSAEEIPEFLLIISDMEFDAGIRYNKTTYERIKSKFSWSKYNMPKIIFWNVNGRLGNVPVLEDDIGVALVSGFSPSIVKSVLSAKNIKPLDVMYETINTGIGIQIEAELDKLSLL